MLTICDAVLDNLVAHAVSQYPNEACGFLIGERGQPSAAEFVPVKNVYDEMHAKYPDTYPRTAKTAYLIDPREQQKIFQQAEENGREVKAIVHSHTDHDAYFSEEDRLVAAPWGEPMFPGISYLVISVCNRLLKEMNEFVWDEKSKDFSQIKRR